MTSPYQSGLLFTQAHRLVRQRIVEVLAIHDITMSHWNILNAIAQAQEGVRLATVASNLGVKAPHITTEATLLIAAGLLVRIPHHTDKRAKLLMVTPQGKKLLANIEKDVNQQILKLMNGLSAKELSAFVKTLQTIIANA